MGNPSFRLVSNNICYGPEPAITDEVEQHLTVSSTGQVWFSARNYAQYCEQKGFCRRKQLNIGAWKAGFLFSMVNALEERPEVTDCGYFDLTIKGDDGSIKRIAGSLIGDDMVPYISPSATSLTRLLRRYIPVYGLWGFDGDFSPDYEGKKAIHLFAKRWVEKLRSPELTIYDFSDHFGEECAALGFQMDCGHQFEKLYPHAFSTDNGLLDTIIPAIIDVDILGSAVFSQYRYLTHWAYYSVLNEKTRHWFIIALNQLRFLTRKQ